MTLPPTLEMMILPSDRREHDTFLTPCYIEWLDSASYSGWRDREDVDHLTPYRCRTMCFLVKETEEHVIVTHTETYGTDASFKKMYLDLLTIPKCVIQRLVRFCEASVP